MGGAFHSRTLSRQEVVSALFRSLSLVALLAAAPGTTVSAELSKEADETLVWNQVMLDAIVASTLGNPQTMRMAATVNTAMFDAWNGVSRKYTPIFVKQTAPPKPIAARRWCRLPMSR